MKKEIKETDDFTFGEKLVGLDFNPSKDGNVGRVKELFAEIADILNKEKNSKDGSDLSNLLFNHSVGEIINSQMSVVKFLTLKY